LRRRQRERRRKVRRPRREAGFSLIELISASAIAVALMGASSVLMDACGKVAKSANDQAGAQMRVQRALLPLTDAIRRGSLASVRHLDGGNFDSETSDSGFQVRRVLDF